MNAQSLKPFCPQISPVILNTVMTITAGMAVKPSAKNDQESPLDVSDLWSVMNIYNCNFWFLGVDQATEMTESFRETDGRNEGETFTAWVKVQKRSSVLELNTDSVLTSCSLTSCYGFHRWSR